MVSDLKQHQDVIQPFQVDGLNLSGRLVRLDETVDQCPDTELYRGIIQFNGATLAECADSYFQQSGQIDTALELEVEKRADGWRAGAISMQRLAELGPGDQPVLPRTVRTAGAPPWRC